MSRLLRSGHLPLLATALVLVLLFGTASLLYDGFFSLRVILNLLGDNAFLGIAAVGMGYYLWRVHPHIREALAAHPLGETEDGD